MGTLLAELSTTCCHGVLASTSEFSKTGNDRNSSAIRLRSRVEACHGVVASSSAERGLALTRSGQSRVMGREMDGFRGDLGIRGEKLGLMRGSVALHVGALGRVEASNPSFLPLELITGEAHFDQVLSEAVERNQPIVIDWLAQWCRKCIYLKPKLEKIAAEYHPRVKFYYVDVNKVPQALVKRAEVTKMPTIQLWKNGEKLAQVIGGHQAWLVMDEVREMINLEK